MNGIGFDSRISDERGRAREREEWQMANVKLQMGNVKAERIEGRTTKADLGAPSFSPQEKAMRCLTACSL